MRNNYLDAKESFMLNLKRLREAKSLSQSDLGELIGVSRQAVSGLENGTSWPSHHTVGKIAKALKCEETDLFKDPNEDKRNLERLEKAKKLLSQI